MPNLVASLAPAGTFTAGGTGTISAGSLAFGTNADRAVAVLVTSISGDVAAVISSVVVGGVTLTPGANVDISNEYGGAGSKGRIFTGTGIPTGSHAPDINWANPNFVGHHIGYAAMAFDDAATLTVTDAGAGTSGTAPAITLTSASGDLMAAFGAWQPDVRATVTAPSAEQFDGLATAQTGTFYGETQTAASSSTTLAATAASTTGGWRMWGLRLQGGAPAATLTGTATLDDVAASGSLASAAPSTLSGSATLDDVAASGNLGTALGRLTSGELETNNSSPHTSAPFEAFVSNKTTGALLLRKEGLTSSASTTAPTCTFTDAALPSVGTQVRVTWRRTDTGAEGTELLTVTA